MTAPHSPAIPVPPTRPLTLINGLAADLAARADAGNPIRIGVIGAGEMGTDLVTQTAMMQGITGAAVAARRPETAIEACAIAGLDAGAYTEVHDPRALERAIGQGTLAIVPDAGLIARSDMIDVVIDATGKPAVAAETGLDAMRHGKHVVMMNVEGDVTIGPYLKREADRLGVVYTVGAGDEPTACMELIDFVTALGYPVVCAGKGKNNPFDPDAVPADYEGEARRRNMNPRMLVEFVDGSKTMVEMSAIANATGLTLDKPGMHGPVATLDTLHQVLCPVEDGGVLSRRGVVDFTLGQGVAPGVFCIAEMRHPRLRERMNDLKLGPGPYYAFYRPHHLTSLEVPLSCARAVLYGTADMVPRPMPSAEVCARAKRDMRPGETLTGIGDTDYRAWAMTYADARGAGALPIGLAEASTVAAPIRKGELLSYANVATDPASKLVQMRRAQDAWLHGDMEAAE